MHTNKPKVVIVMPAYNAERTVKDTYFEIPKNLRGNIILVDDGSRDNTVKVAKDLGITVFEHTNNLGYGGNQKTCYWEALKLSPDVVVMLHPDYQYDATLIEDLITPIVKGRYDFMFGSRIANKKAALDGGMPKIKYYVNRLVCLIQNILLGVNFTEHFSGLRAYSAKLLKTIPFQRFSNDFVFDQEMTISALSHGFNIGEIPIPTRYHEKASSIQFFRGAKFITEGFMTIMALYANNMNLIRDSRFLAGEKRNLIAAWRVLNGITLAGLFLVFLMTALAGGVDKQLFTVSSFEKDKIAKRQEFYSRQLGRLYRNRFGIYYFNELTVKIEKVLQKIAHPLDIRLYFSASQKSIFGVYTLPLATLGLFYLLYRERRFVLLYLGLAMTGSIIIQTGQSVYLLLPFIGVCILLGLAKVVGFITKPK